MRFHFIEITLRHGCSPVNLLLIFKKAFRRNTSGRLLLTLQTLSKALKTFTSSKDINRIFIANNTHLSHIKFSTLTVFIKIIEFESCCIVIYASYIHQIVDGKRSAIN